MPRGCLGQEWIGNETVLCALSADIPARGAVGKLQLTLLHQPRAESMGQIRAEIQVGVSVTSQFRSGCNVFMLTWH